MSDIFYNFGYYLMAAIPLLIIIFCVSRIRRNKAILENAKKEQEDAKNTSKDS